MHSNEIQAGREYLATYMGREVLVRAMQPMHGRRNDWVCSRRSDWSWCIVPAGDFLQIVEPTYS